MPPASWSGVGVSAGVAVGPVARVEGPVLPQDTGPPPDPAAAAEAAAAALAAVAHELDGLAAKAGVSGAVVGRQARIARDPSLEALSRQLVRAGRTAPRAAWEAFTAYRDLRASDPVRPAPAGAELDDVRDRVVARLLGEPPPAIPDPGVPFVLVARDLSPALTAGLDPARVLALVTERGGPTSHTAVLAKSLGIPAIVGCAGAGALRSGQRVVVDGRAGLVTVEPDAATVGEARSRSAAAVVDTGGPGRLRDGRPVALLAAVGAPADVAEAVAAGAEGVGVFRTEFCFLDRDQPPSVAEQVDAYLRVLDGFPGLPVTVRTLDIGADKPARFVPLGDQPNPALGVRGLRVARRFPALLDDQLTALGRAASRTKAQVHVMAPMVATTGEAAWFATQARAHGIRSAGVMVEVPAAALRAGDLLRIVDFVSVGSNDLASYTFAADRADGELADLLDPWQPAFLELVASVLRAGARAGMPVNVCGEAPSDPMLAVVLVGLGAAGLSMAPRALPAVRATLAQWTLADCERAAAGALGADGPEEARGWVAEIGAGDAGTPG